MEPPPSQHPKTPARGTPLVLIGGVAALLAGGAIAWTLLSGDSGDKSPPPASVGGLIIDSSALDESNLDPAKPLRCFVRGKFVGEFSLTDCAQRNGVATDALDVGIDDSGALAAAEQAGQTLVPLPPSEYQPDLPVTPVQPASRPQAEPAAAPAPGTCWRYGGARWRKLPGDIGLDACVQTLFSGRCEKPGGATYGRWGQQTLRLVTGRVEISDDNRTFRPIAPQANDCTIAPVG